jgi:DNA polymerase-3 subunit epsilon
MSGVLHTRIDDMPIAVVDFETTGLTPGRDRVVEIAIVRRDPGGSPKLVLDTLINPCRRVAATEIHGITDRDVEDAPRFHEVVDNILQAVSGCVIAAYNVYFDMRFLKQEFLTAGVEVDPPHLCVMYMRPLLGLGGRCGLIDACRAHSIQYEQAHTAAKDAVASAMGIETFGHLASLRDYKFFQSFVQTPCTHADHERSPCDRLKTRVRATTQLGEPTIGAVRTYWDALKSILDDLEIEEYELELMRDLRSELQLPEECIRVLHARAFASAIDTCVDDQWLSDDEVHRLCKLKTALARLGWAPGELPVSNVEQRASKKLRKAEVAFRVSIPFTPRAAEPTGPLAGKTLVVTGTLEKYKREEIEALIEQLGGKAGSGVSKKTDYLVAGAEAGSKLAKAEKLGVKVLTEAEFDELISGGLLGP